MKMKKQKRIERYLRLVICIVSSYEMLTYRYYMKNQQYSNARFEISFVGYNSYSLRYNSNRFCVPNLCFCCRWRI